MRADMDLVQRAVVAAIAVVYALFYRAFDALVGIVVQIHHSILLFGDGIILSHLRQTMHGATQNIIFPRRPQFPRRSNRQIPATACRETALALRR